MNGIKVAGLIAIYSVLMIIGCSKKNASNASQEPALRDIVISSNGIYHDMNTNNYLGIITSDGAGGAIVTFQSSVGGNPSILTQRIDKNGNILWGANSAVAAVPPSYQTYFESPVITHGCDGGAIIAWFAYSKLCTTQYNCITYNYIYVQRLDPDGNALWGANGISVGSYASSSNGGSVDMTPGVISDGSCGAIVTWQFVNGIYAQRINPNGNALWTPNGITISTTSAGYPKIIPDGSGGAIISYYGLGLKAQRIDSNGNLMWGPGGITVNPSMGSQVMVTDGKGGAIISFIGSGLKAQRVDSNGNLMWGPDGTTVSPSMGSQVMATDGKGGAIIAGIIYTNSNVRYVYAQHVDANGNVLWQNNGIPLCTAPYGRDNPFIVSDGAGGAIVVWQDYRADPTQSYSAIYAQRIMASGALLWELNGMLISTLPDSLMFPIVTADPYGNAWIMYWDNGVILASYVTNH